jgi:hypothetical protein
VSKVVVVGLMLIGGLISGLIFLLIFGAAWAALGFVGAAVLFGAIGLALAWVGRRQSRDGGRVAT